MTPQHNKLKPNASIDQRIEFSELELCSDKKNKWNCLLSGIK